jgi:hypothetical protein
MFDRLCGDAVAWMGPLGLIGGVARTNRFKGSVWSVWVLWTQKADVDMTARSGAALHADYHRAQGGIALRIVR